MTTTPETTNTTPAALIGCLACYNNGTLRGKWITAQQAADDIAEAERTDGTLTYAGQAEPATYPSGTTYARCVQCGGDEFDVFDTQHLGTIRPSVMSFYRDAEQLADLDDAGTLEQLLALTGWLGSASLADLIDYNENNYGGQWDSWQAFADDYADNFAGLDRLPDDLRYYFDYEKYARDLAHSYYYDEATGHVWHSA